MCSLHFLEGGIQVVVADSVVILDVAQEVFKLFGIGFPARIDHQVADQLRDLIPLIIANRRHHPGEDLDGPVVIGAGVVEHEEQLVLSHHRFSFPAAVLPLQMNLGTGNRPLCNENRLAGYTRRLSGNIVQFYRSRPDKISQIAAYGGDSHDDPFCNHRQDEKDKSDGKHLQRLRSGCQPHQERGSGNESKEKCQEIQDASGQAGQEDPDPLCQDDDQHDRQEDHLHNEFKQKHS